MTDDHAVTDSRDDLPFMVHSDLDDLDLTPFEFRAYSHMVRRAGSKGGEYWESVEAGAKHCRMDAKTYRAALKALVERGLLTRSDRPGETSVYRITPRRAWRTPTKSGRATTSGTPTRNGRGTPTKSGRTPLPETVAKVLPLKGIPGRESPKELARAKFDPLEVDLPEGVTREAWAEFVAHRAEKNRKLTPSATKRTLEDLVSKSKTPEERDEMLRVSIARSWTGVFALDGDKSRDPAKRAATDATNLLAHLEGRR